MNNKIIIINGPNLNLLGEREQSQYGSTTYDQLKENCSKKAKEIGLDVEFDQAIFSSFGGKVPIANIGTLSSIDECGEILFDEGDLCGSFIGRGGRVVFTNIQTDCTPGGLETTMISVSEGPICFYEFTVEGFCCPNYNEVSMF